MRKGHNMYAQEGWHFQNLREVPLGWPAGENPRALVILAWVRAYLSTQVRQAGLGHFLPRKSDKEKFGCRPIVK